MALTIANPGIGDAPVDLTGVTPDALASLSLDAVRRTAVHHGNRPTPLGELFRIDGDPADGVWRLAGEFNSVHGIGAGMKAGEITVDGSLGHRAGAAMSGGRLEIRGDAGDSLGAEMRGGAIRLRGSAGGRVGGALPGARRGMTSGEILIDGSAGDELGMRMRRGLIAVAGAVGDAAGLRMLAGTILVLGDCGQHPGAAMRRGTIGLFGQARPALPPTFRRACRAALPVLRLLAAKLRGASFAPATIELLLKPVELFHGDLLEQGRGEILLPA